MSFSSPMHPHFFLPSFPWPLTDIQHTPAHLSLIWPHAANHVHKDTLGKADAMTCPLLARRNLKWDSGKKLGVSKRTVMQLVHGHIWRLGWLENHNPLKNFNWKFISMDLMGFLLGRACTFLCTSLWGDSSDHSQGTQTGSCWAAEISLFSLLSLSLSVCSFPLFPTLSYLPFSLPGPLRG